MVYKCAVFGCKSNYDSTEERVSVFKAPPVRQNPVKRLGMLEEWRKVIPIPKHKINANTRVCERHLLPEFIIREHTEIKLPDGSVFKERKKPTLAPNAIPSIFKLEQESKVPEYLNVKLPKQRKDPSLRKQSIDSSQSRKRIHSEDNKSVPSPKKALEDIQILDVTDPESETQSNGVGIMNTADMNNKSLYDIVYDNPQQVLLPHPMWTSVKGPDSIAFIEFTNNNNIFVAQKQVILARSNEKVTLSTVYISNKKTDLRREMHNVQEVVDFIKEIDKHKPCPGLLPHSGFRDESQKVPHVFQKKKCIRKEERRQNGKNKKRKKKSRKVQREKRALLRKVERLNDKLEQMQVQYDTLKETQIEDLTKNLPPRQKEAVLACIHCAKAKGPNGRRYTQQWMYECALLRIKSPALYRKMRRDQTLALPSPRTLQRYMKRLKPAYGFLPATFEMLEKKSKEMEVDERHGCLMFDEMCLTPCLHFNCNLLKIQGFVTLGDHTPGEQKDQPGDHALVYMFKPWKGPWFQRVGAFLSKGAVKGPVLGKLSLEATCLLEKAGFHVDMWVCDGASWNRQMWTELGLKNPFTAKKRKDRQFIKGKTSFAHPCDPDRRIYMCSDFPHLIKSLKSRILPSKDKGNVKDLVTPEGTVKFSHWEALWQADNARDKPIQRCYKLTRDHLYPHNYQTMNVGMAFTFFSGGVADAMESYKEEGYQGLEDSGPTIKFIRRVNALIDAMNANTPWDSIRGADDDLDEDEENESGDEEVERNEHGFKKKKSARQVINQFLNYLVKWAAMPGKQAAKLAHQTQYGLYVTLTSALEMSDYLINTHDFSYVMTRRMNQDAIEHFFGDVRQAFGCNTHPDPVQFIQVYRLLSVASLIKAFTPPKKVLS
ncbi:hypothetical protein FOCC_FOCC016761 [Frankliniella occidentalis]|nr:hypothetical protein FOCC_FOCC016761 [Frankliniella occidentalis]